jgi:PAS domain S-box-containing protein
MKTSPWLGVAIFTILWAVGIHFFLADIQIPQLSYIFCFSVISMSPPILISMHLSRSARKSEFVVQKTRDALLESEMKNQEFFINNPQPMWIIDDTTMRFLEVNSAAITKYGYSREEFLQMSLKDIRPKAKVPQFLSNFRRVLAGTNRITGSIHVSKDGTEFTVDVVVCPTTYRGRPARLSMATDVSERMQALEMLVQSKEAAESANRAKTRFLANISHEMRTPLAAILGFTELMKDPSQSRENQEKCLQTILRNGKQLSKIIDDLLDLSKIESEKMEIERLHFSPMDVLSEVLTLLRPQADEKGVAIKLKVDGSIPGEIVSDPTRVRQILTNLIHNAIKFTAKGSVTITVKAFQSPTGSPMLQFEIQDHGIGISGAQRERLFQPFAQADSSTTRMFGGTGLGLALSHRLARILNGDLKLIYSEIGQGSTFLLTLCNGNPTAPQSLPCVQTVKNWAVGTGCEAAVAKNLLGTSDTLKKDGRMVQILVVEDSKDISDLLAGFLQSESCHVTCVENGVLGIQAVEKQTFDVVLMDIQMPKMDGYQAVRKLRDLGFRQPIIALTAHALNTDRDRCLAAGFNDHIAKPVTRTSLIGALERAVSSL